MSILLADDNRSLADFLSKSGCSVHTAVNEASVISELQRQNYQLVIVDLNFGQEEGLKLLEKLRAEGLGTSVLVLSTHDRMVHRIHSLNLGRADWIARPFSFEQVAAKVRSFLERDPYPYLRVLRVEDLELNPASSKAYRGSREIDLNGREFAALRFLMESPGVPVSRHELSRHLLLEARYCSYCVNHLRKKVDWPFEKRLIFKKRGRGYQIGQSESVIDNPSKQSASEHSEEPIHTLDLSEVRKESDALRARMQRPESRAAMRAAYNASPEQLGEAALAAVRKRKRG
jgi:two-component system OmpR family response regulator